MARPIRPVREQDLPLLYSWLSSPRLLEDYDTPTVVDPLELKRRFECNGLNGSDTQWRMICSPAGRVVGLLTLDLGCTDAAAEIGFMIPDLRMRRKGYAKAAVLAAIEEVRPSARVRRIKALVHPENHASIKLLECVGFRLCGTAKRHRFVKGKWQDFFVYSIEFEKDGGRS